MISALSAPDNNGTDALDVWVVEDNPTFRRAVTALLEDEPTTRCSLSVDSSEPAVEAVQDGHCPHVVLMDIGLPRLSGMEATRRIVKRAPSIRVLACSQYTDAETVLEMVRSGAHGYINKSAVLDELLLAIRRVADGKHYLGQDVSGVRQVGLWNSRARQPDTLAPPRLTGREREVLQLVAEGLPTKTIAHRLGISYKTADTHRQNMMQKLGLRTVAELTKYAIREGLTQLDS